MKASLERRAQADAKVASPPDMALQTAFNEHHSFLKSYITRRTNSAQDAEDLAQDVYLRALQFSRRGNNVANWRGILIRIAADLMVDRFRRNRTRAVDRHAPVEDFADLSDEGLHSPERILEARQRISDVERTLESLDPDCRSAFVMVRFQGCSYAEVSRVLNIDTIAVGRLIERATLRLVSAAARDSVLAS